MKLTAQVRNGKLIPDSPVGWTIALQAVQGKRVVVTIEAEKKRRTLSQNAYYHACITPVVAYLLTEAMRKLQPEADPVSDEEAHEALKKRFLGQELVCGLPVVRSTTRLSTVGFSDYVERCRMFAAEAGFFIPAPGEPAEVME